MDDNAATVIIGQRVRPGCEQAFIKWQHELNDVASHYPGFIGAEVNAPTGVQPEWIVVYRFDSIANVAAWINSSTRQEKIKAGRDFFDGPPTQQVAHLRRAQATPGRGKAVRGLRIAHC
jgi:antibiotic biosynthesis monooxygenase (ABM) superfamily enzyme